MISLEAKMVSTNFSEASSSTAATNNTFGVKPEVQNKKKHRQAKKGKKVSLQEFYQETPNYFQPPKVVPFVR